jgi:hypothetical protein
VDQDHRVAFQSNTLWEVKRVGELHTAKLIRTYSYFVHLRHFLKRRLQRPTPIGGQKNVRIKGNLFRPQEVLRWFEVSMLLIKFPLAGILASLRIVLQPGSICTYGSRLKRFD